MKSVEYEEVIYSLAVLSFIIFSVARSKSSKRKIFKISSIWAVIILIMFIGYSYKQDIKKVFDRVYANLVPTSSINEPNKVTLIADQSGHFVVKGLVNGTSVDFLVDTGATRVSLSWDDAKRLGINSQDLNYTIRTETANGLSWSAPIAIDYIKIGDIVIKNVKASVSSSKLRTSLLGMSFLEKLEHYKVSEDVMVMVGNH